MGRKVPTLYEWAGKEEAIERLIAIFYGHAVKDKLLGPIFRHMPPAHIHHVALWFCEILGGPKFYSDKYGRLKAHPHMISAHVGLQINVKQRRRWNELMSVSLDDARLPSDPEFRSAFMAYVEWGTRMAMMFSHATKPPPESPMPKWGWGERKPYIPEESNK